MAAVWDYPDFDDHEVVHFISDRASGLQAIVRGQAHGMRLWMGGADPRREGLVMGD